MSSLSWLLRFPGKAAGPAEETPGLPALCFLQANYKFFFKEPKLEGRLFPDRLPAPKYSGAVALNSSFGTDRISSASLMRLMDCSASFCRTHNPV